MRVPPRTLPLVLVLLSLVASACGGSSEGSTDVAEPTLATDEAVTEAAEAPTPDDPQPGPEALPEPTADPAPVATPTEEDEKDAAPIEFPDGPPTEGLPGGRYVRINAIVAEGAGYMVEFEPFNFEPLIGSGPEDFHIHFFWNTLEPQNAGTNGPAPGDWFLYDGPSPFGGYTRADKPAAATQLCALVADASHGVTLGTGNCVDLPA